MRCAKERHTWSPGEIQMRHSRILKSFGWNLIQLKKIVLLLFSDQISTLKIRHVSVGQLEGLWPFCWCQQGWWGVRSGGSSAYQVDFTRDSLCIFLWWSETLKKHEIHIFNLVMLGLLTFSIFLRIQQRNGRKTLTTVQVKNPSSKKSTQWAFGQDLSISLFSSKYMW